MNEMQVLNPSDHFNLKTMEPKIHKTKLFNSFTVIEHLMGQSFRKTNTKPGQ